MRSRSEQNAGLGEALIEALPVSLLCSTDPRGSGVLPAQRCRWLFLQRWAKQRPKEARGRP